MFGIVSSFAASNNAYGDASQNQGPVGFAGAGGISAATSISSQGLMSS